MLVEPINLPTTQLQSVSAINTISCEPIVANIMGVGSYNLDTKIKVQFCGCK